MSFIMENVQTSNDRNLEVTSLLFEQNKIAAIRKKFPYYTHMRVDTTGLVLTPTSVVFDEWIGKNQSTVETKTIQEGYIAQGITTIVTTVAPKFLHSFEVEWRTRKKELVNACLDYVLCLTCPIEKLSEDWLRACQKVGISTIIVEIGDIEVSQRIMLKWRWFKEVVRFSPLMFIPKIITKDSDKRTKWEAWWKSQMPNYFLPHTTEELVTGRILSVSQGKRIGLFPKRGKLVVGGEVTYNLFFQNDSVEERRPFHYDDSTLAVTIHRGKALYVMGKIHYIPGFGQELCRLHPNTFV